MLKRIDFFILLARLFLGYIFISSGLCKMTLGHFGQLIGPPQLETELVKHGLGPFWGMIGITQVICGLLIFSQPFSTLGAIMLLPMNICITGLTISMGWQGTPYVNGAITALNLIVLFYDWHKLKFLFAIYQFHDLRTTMLDKLNINSLNISALVSGAVAMATAQFNYQLTAVFGILCFSLICLSIIKSRLCNKLQITILILATANMIMITLSFGPSSMAMKLTIANSLVLLILYIVSLFMPAPRLGGSK